MMKRSHIVIGALGSLAVYPHPGLVQMMFVSTGAVMGSILPDLDLRVGLHHRGITHWLIWPVIIAAVYWQQPLIAGCALGWIFHIAADCLTVEGLAPFWPLRVRLRGFLRTGSVMEYFMVILITTSLLYKLIL